MLAHIAAGIESSLPPTLNLGSWGCGCINPFGPRLLGTPSLVPHSGPGMVGGMDCTCLGLHLGAQPSLRPKPWAQTFFEASSASTRCSSCSSPCSSPLIAHCGVAILSSWRPAPHRRCHLCWVFSADLRACSISGWSARSYPRVACTSLPPPIFGWLMPLLTPVVRSRSGCWMAGCALSINLWLAVHVAGMHLAPHCVVEIVHHSIRNAFQTFLSKQWRNSCGAPGLRCAPALHWAYTALDHFHLGVPGGWEMTGHLGSIAAI